MTPALLSPSAPADEAEHAYARNYGGGEFPHLVEMVEVGPHQFVRRDVAVALGLRIVEE